MSLEVRFSVVCVAMLVAGLGSASGLTGDGEYTTHVPEDQLFIDGGRILSSDIVFNIPGKETVVAPKGSELRQTIPSIVWQYSGLLPVTDYVKSAAIHSVSSETQDRPWQDVQHNFYEGLLVEGAYSTNAKIAYAGAYAFAPRWPLTEVVEEASAAGTNNTDANGDTAALKVEHTQPSVQGMSIESYRELSLQIFQQAEEISLLDIQAAIDAIDKKQARSLERASLGGISSIDSNSNEVITSIGDTTIKTTTSILGSVEPVESAAIVENVASIDQQSSKMNTLKVSDSTVEETAPEAAISGVIGIVVGGNQTLRHSGDRRVLKLADSEVFSGRELLSVEDDFANEALDDDKSLNEELMTKEIGESATVINAEDTQPSAVFSGETFEVVELDEANPAVAANSITDMPEPAAVLRPVAISKSAEFARLPVDKLFVSDDAIVNSNQQQDGESGDGLDVAGAPVDLSGLVIEENLFNQEAPKNELSEVVAENVTAEEESGADEEWVVLPDGTLVLQTLNKLYAE